MSKSRRIISCDFCGKQLCGNDHVWVVKTKEAKKTYLCSWKCFENVLFRSFLSTYLGLSGGDYDVMKACDLTEEYYNRYGK